MQTIHTPSVEFSIQRYHQTCAVTATCLRCGTSIRADGYTRFEADEVLADRMDKHVCPKRKLNQQNK